MMEGMRFSRKKKQGDETVEETELSALDKWYMKQAAEKEAAAASGAPFTTGGTSAPQDLSAADAAVLPDVLAMIDEAGIGTTEGPAGSGAAMAEIAAMPEAPEITRTPPPRQHLSAEERAAIGKQARKETPRSSHAEFSPSDTRPDPISILELQAVDRVPDLVPIRYGRMLVSPFTFFRGAAAVMAADLATTPTSGIRVQACGDAHLSNFGLFASPERKLVFDVNDFDETLPGPWEYDVKRLATSVVIAARDQEFTDAEIYGAALAAASGYREAMRTLAKSSTMDVWYSHIDAEALLVGLQDAAKTSGSKAGKQMAAKTAKVIDKAKTRNSLQALEKLTTVVDGERRIISDPPLVVPITEIFPQVESDAISEMLHGLVRRYRHSLQSDRRHLVESFELKDVARKVVGVGSVGTRAWIMLLLGVNGDPLFLQAKEAVASVLEPYVGRSSCANHAQRVVTGQHLMQASSDIFLGWERVDGLDGQSHDYYIRQLRDMKGSFEVDGSLPQGLTQYASVCGRALARAHARSGDRIAIASYLGAGPQFDEAIASFAHAYADQNALDYAALQAARDTGRIQATSGY
jgi:uncharacterized protein (DUF2252 family)